MVDGQMVPDAEARGRPGHCASAQLLGGTPTTGGKPPRERGGTHLPDYVWFLFSFFEKSSFTVSPRADVARMARMARILCDLAGGGS